MCILESGVLVTTLGLHSLTVSGRLDLTVNGYCRFLDPALDNVGLVYSLCG